MIHPPHISTRALILPVAGLLLLLGTAGPLSAASLLADKVVVLKRERLLMLLKGGEILRRYRVALGRQPLGRKFRQGDGKTPEGLYVLDRRNAASRFYRSLHISYPNAADVALARRCGVDPGRDIMIHGLPRGFEELGSAHTARNWTKGCIAVSNGEMDEIWHLVPDGTPIEIKP
ncbi:MAG TPA: L,D-transpeptidase family protein [Desulfuromonadaceae bacterium]